jgi:cytochrome c oxidase subunit 2
MARFLAIAIWVTAATVVCFFTWSKWWLPEAVSAHAAAVDRQFDLTLAIIGAGFILTHTALGLAVWRYRAKNGERAAGSQGNARIKFALAALVAVVFIGLAVTGQRVWAELGLNREAPGAVRVEVVAQQFAWNFRYPGPDGRFGRTDPHLYNDADNSIGARPGPLGIDSRDAAGKDDVVSPLMVVPVNRPISARLRSKDVIHDFYVPALRLKQDAVPGMQISINFTATKEGRYEIACAELCGQFHHQMRAYLEVRSQAEYENWLKERSVSR